MSHQPCTTRVLVASLPPLQYTHFLVVAVQLLPIAAHLGTGIRVVRVAARLSLAASLWHLHRPNCHAAPPLQSARALSQCSSIALCCLCTDTPRSSSSCTRLDSSLSRTFLSAQRAIRAARRHGQQLMSVIIVSRICSGFGCEGMSATRLSVPVSCPSVAHE